MSATREGLMNSRFRRNHVAHPIVLETNHRIRDFVQSGERFLRLRRAAFSFEGKGQRRKSDHERTGFARQLRHDRRRARAGAAAEAGANKNHPRTGNRLREFRRPIPAAW